MRCPDCDYELHERRGESQECPRCAFRRTLPAPSPAPASSPRPAAAPAMTAEALAPARPRQWAGVLLAGVALAGAATGAVALVHQGRGGGADSPEAQVRTIFAAADGPCRRGDVDVCRESMGKIRGLHDPPDASLLLTDLKVARYLHTLSGGDQLSRRWQSDQITQTELSAMGDDAYHKGLSVYRSLWISAGIKRDSVPVPMLVFDGTKPPITDAPQ